MWVPIQESGVAFQLVSASADVRIEDSNVFPDGNAARPYPWSIVITGGPIRIGVTPFAVDSRDYPFSDPGDFWPGGYSVTDNAAVYQELWAYQLSQEEPYTVFGDLVTNEAGSVIGSSEAGTQLDYQVPYGTGEVVIPMGYNTRVWVWSDGPTPDADDFNCDCDATYERKTLLQMYERVMRRAGYAAQLSRPPPGVKELVIDFINEAERLTMADLEEIGHRRFFRWQLEEGVRRYGVDENIDVCARVFNQLRPKGVYLVRNGEWTRLRRGINPEWYSGGVHNTSPTHYEIRQCIEVWPAPSADAGLLVIEGAFKVGEMVSDGDYTSADPEAVFLRALALYKAHKQQPDAQVAMGQYDRYIGNINADEHSDRRYVPPDRIVERRDCDRLVRRMSPGIYGDDP